MKRFLLIFVAWIIIQPTFATAAETDPEAHYQTLLSAAKETSDPVDWQALRFAYAERPSFVVDTPNDNRRGMFNAAHAGNWPQALALTQKVIDGNYADGGAHLMASIANIRAGNVKEGAHEAIIAQAIFKSIQTGDGLTPEHAFTVIEVREEYDLMGFMNLKLNKQALSGPGDHMYDIMETEDQAGKVVTYYFNIDRVWAAEIKALHLQ